jgi:hypothetical protein
MIDGPNYGALKLGTVQYSRLVYRLKSLGQAAKAFIVFTADTFNN